MDHISGRMMRGSNCSMSSTTSTQSSDEDEILMNHMELRRGPWTVEEDELLINYIVNHGEGRWNSLAQSAGLKRTGKSCRLRWLNYLRPDVRRGNITPEEQLMILELHSRWGNRWSKIAQYLPGRTDNEIKNYWRTRVQKHAKQLRCDVNSKLFKDTMRYIWMPRLAEKIRAAETTLSCTTTTTTTNTTHDHVMNNNNNLDHFMTPPGDLAVVPLNSHTDDFAGARVNPSCSSFNNCHNNNENCSTTTAASSDSFGTTLQQQVSPVSDLTTDHYQNNYPPSQEPNYNAHLNYSDSSLISPSGYFNYHGLNHPFQGSTTYDQQMNNNNVWSGASTDDLWDNLWTPEDTWFLQQQF